MENIPLGTIVAILVVLLLLSAFFSIAETAMMAINRYRLRHLVQQGQRGARLTAELLARTDRLLGVILLCNNLINAAAATLVAFVTVQLFGDSTLALSIGTALITFAIVVFSEITPKVVGAAYAERIALPSAYVLKPLLKLAYPAVWFVNLFVRALLALLRIKPADAGEPKLSLEELRTLVLESSHYLPQKHHSILVNLFELESITVDDVMTPRHSIEAIDLDAPIEDTRSRIATCYHTRLPAYHGQLDDIAGVLHVRHAVNLGGIEGITAQGIAETMREPYFIPAGTALLSQLQNFQERRDRLGLVVDEYGELKGLVTIDDILEEIIGEFTTHSPMQPGGIHRQPDGSVLVEGSTPLRDLNREIGAHFPLDGPKTLNGLILEHLQDIPEPGVSVKIADQALEITQTQERVVKAVRIRPVTKATVSETAQG
ncbi:MAG TPA: HlyC/CorC family transporter [Burkholderiales bacterium]|nr:HlyC/CorC family transporter [Burkholderiales bacterium]